MPWNIAPELCATQVEDQSFFFIEECLDLRVSKEKDCIRVVNILQGHATGKQIEQQMIYLVGSNTWKWNARQVAENRFVMRFPSAAALHDWTRLKAIAMNDVEAFIRIEKYTHRTGAKGELQQA